MYRESRKQFLSISDNIEIPLIATRTMSWLVKFRTNFSNLTAVILVLSSSEFMFWIRLRHIKKTALQSRPMYADCSLFLPKISLSLPLPPSSFWLLFLSLSFPNSYEWLVHDFSILILSQKSLFHRHYSILIYIVFFALKTFFFLRKPGGLQRSGLA